MDPNAVKHVNRADKVSLPHAGQHGSKGVDAKPDWQIVKATALTAIDQIDAGHYTMDALGQVEKANGSKEDEQRAMQAMRGMKANQQFLWFIRGEVDTTKQGAPMDQAHPLTLVSAAKAA